jgi:hypothetical protein
MKGHHDGPPTLTQTKEAVEVATETVKETTKSIANAIGATRSDAPLLDRLAGWTRKAPLQALAVAFLAGALIARGKR